MTNLKTTIEFEDARLAHGESDSEEAAVKEFLAKLAETQAEEARAMTAEAARLAAEERAKLLERSLICSCGHFTCPSVGRFGHPVPVFKESIEPLWPQSVRDQVALKMKEGGAN